MSAAGPLGPNNPKLLELRRLLGRRSSRLDAGAYVIEGPTLVAEAIRVGVDLRTVFVEERAAHAWPGATIVRDGSFERLGSTRSPQPVLAVASLPHGLVPADPTFVVVSAGIADPGNLGTILRTAEAAGADAVVVMPGGADPFSPKVVRASAGAVFHVPIVFDDPTSLGLPLVGTVATGGEPYEEADLHGPLALVLGNESHGLPDGLKLDRLITIGHVGRSESLNVAMAASVVCFEIARQRRQR